ncbi:hypothetical protein LCGC14_2914100, partial [marine sediment metagenome]
MSNEQTETQAGIEVEPGVERPTEPVPVVEPDKPANAELPILPVEPVVQPADEVDSTSEQNTLDGSGPKKDEEPTFGRIAPHYVRINRAHTRRIERLTKEFTKAGVDDANKELKDLGDTAEKARNAYEDARDSEHIQTGNDPEATGTHLRDGGDVKTLRGLARLTSKAIVTQNERAKEIANELDATLAAKRLDKANESHAVWLDLFYVEFETSPANVDWGKEHIERRVNYE